MPGRRVQGDKNACQGKEQGDKKERVLYINFFTEQTITPTIVKGVLIG